MVIIGIAGSTAARRDEVGDAAVDAQKARLMVHAIRNPATCSHPTARRNRARRLVESASDVRGVRGIEGVVFSQVHSEEEAQALRDLGGVMWHVQGVPSEEVVIRRGDLLVTWKAGGDRHFLDPLEALSATLLAQRARVAS